MKEPQKATKQSSLLFDLGCFASLAMTMLGATDQPIGTATNCVLSAVFTRISTSCLPSDFASASALRSSRHAADALAADIEDDVAGLQAVLGGRAIGIDAGDHDALVAGARDLAGGRNRQAEMRRARASEPLSCSSALACFRAGSASSPASPSGLGLALAQDVELDASCPGAIAEISRASVARVLDRRCR